MHQALLVCEILLEIFKHVNDIDWQNPIMISYHEVSLVRTSLAALARTCKTFYEPAMNELWAKISGLNPLLGCVTRLRPIIYCAERTWCNPPYFGDVEPLSANEARQFLHHAARVRSIHIELATNRDFRLLSVLPEETCMFPRLQTLFTASLPCPTRYLHLFLSPTLRLCALWVIDSNLKLIVTRCAALEHLSVKHTDGTIADKLPILSDSVRLCKRLVTLSCPPLDWAAWEHLSNLPTLLTVTIRMNNIVPSPSDLDNITFGPFLNLTALSFLADTAAYITTLVQHSEFPSLKKIDLFFHRLPCADAERLLHALSQCKACQTLERIRIKSYSSEVQDPDSSWTAITQLRCCPQLRTLELEFPGCCTHLDNDHLLEAMSCWPYIRSLELEDKNYPQATVTFRGLLAALRQCPHLDELRMLIDAVNIDVDSTAESLRHTSLQLLHVRSSEVVDTKAVAHIIFSMLPSVDKIYHSPMNSNHANTWREVRNHLKHFRSSAVLDSQDAAAET
ncbi:hypothetical protein DFJ58DRAFT_742471 [Suillus subalutaceus]|uniref:uncharacterized protein n=1 Tax=Suillus subalutaceus TaxID=48586 RepID=UPI001B86CEC3|nr:uncharacterized protein DFJ58DRAFT_742471 [Suillus subalutaceus]KAG1869396.1 hypothetical protein DFJ58DRAFT_742471 [Suillus subalutaceus]